MVVSENTLLLARQLRADRHADRLVVRRAPHRHRAVADVKRLPAVALLWLRGEEHGRSWATMLFAVTWSADIVAYAVGNVVKGPKLWPKFSPNKTWSGFVGGLAGAVVAAIAVAVLSRLKISIGAAAAVGLVGGLATMTGDLWESILKRRYGVKDSGDLIPGHGGLLDRVDGLMFAAVIVAGARLIAFIGFPF